MSIGLQDDIGEAERLFGEPGEIILNLQLTTACGFACRHCMYACHPIQKEKQPWMDEADIDQVLNLAAEFLQANHSVRINMIGGEPSLDLDRLDRLLGYLRGHPKSQGISCEMTTNGWWLRSWETLCRFAEAVGPMLRESDLTIRISNSIYHDPFRTRTEKLIISEDAKQRRFGYGERMASRLETALECPFDYYEFIALCPECNAALGDQTCSQCGLEISEDDYAAAQDKAYAAPGHEWVGEFLRACREDRLYVDARVSDDSKVSPVGRAAKNGIGHQATACWDGTSIFTVAPEGVSRESAARGAMCPSAMLGTEPGELYALAFRYIRSIEREFPGRTPARCRHCSAFASKWVSRQKPVLARLLRQADQGSLWRGNPFLAKDCCFLFGQLFPRRAQAQKKGGKKRTM